MKNLQKKREGRKREGKICRQAMIKMKKENNEQTQDEVHGVVRSPPQGLQSMRKELENRVQFYTRI
jgi:hypothetical protein